jgi:hypothetical protein
MDAVPEWSLVMGGALGGKLQTWVELTAPLSLGVCNLDVPVGHSFGTIYSAT